MSFNCPMGQSLMATAKKIILRPRSTQPVAPGPDAIHPVTLRPNAVRPKGLPAVLLLAFGLIGCRPAVSGGEETPINIAVSPSLAPVAASLTEEFNRMYPQGIPLTVEIAPEAPLRTASDAGCDAVLDWREPPAGDWSARVGWTGIRFVVHPDNPMADLSSDEVRKIFRGWIVRWEEAGGASGDIHALAYGEDSGPADIFAEAVLGGSRLAGGAILMPTIYAMLSTVREDPLAVGYLPAFDPAADLKALTVDGADAVYPNLLSGKYPFRIPIYLDAIDPPLPEIKQFAGWAQSVPGQTVLMQLHPQE
jgi:phosphate transport system substrate-binding protein